MDRAEENTLVRKLARMDSSAWEVFCREYWLSLLTYVESRFGCNRPDSEEIVQMTFVRCVKSIRNFRPSRGRLFDWLKAISRNEGHTLLGREQKRLATESLGSQAGHVQNGILEKIDSVALPEDLLERKEVQLLVHETIMELYYRYRKALILKYIDNRKVSEIAAVLGQSEKAVESLLSRSREAFREVFLRKVRSWNAEEGGLLI